MMATPGTIETRAVDRRKQVMVGELPADFLRTGSTATYGHENEQIGRILHAQQQAGSQQGVASNIIGKLSISVVQARLTKNYGLTKMDPYCRVRVGSVVFETPTDYNGGKSPRWNRTVNALLLTGVDTVYLEMFDERSFTLDNQIAWTHIKIPEAVKNGGTVDDWFPLSGKKGEHQEGSINITLTLLPPDTNTYNYMYSTAPMMMPMYYPQMLQHPVIPQVLPPQGVAPVFYPQMPVYPPQQPIRPLYIEEDLKIVKDMFPNMELEVVKSVMEANHGNKDAAINSLLAMSSG